MPDTARPARKPLTLPRSFSRVLGRLLTLPPAESLALATAAHAEATDPGQRVLAMRLRLRLLQEAVERSAAQETPADPPEPEPEPAPEPEPEPDPQPEPPAPKEPKLTQIDPASDALAAMMSELGDGEDGDDFFGDG